MNPRRLIIIAVAIVAIAAGTWASYRLVVPPATPRVATVLPSPVELPEFSLLDQAGREIHRDVFAGQWDLLFFGFTRCPDVCPLTLQVLATARSQLADAGEDPLPRIVLVSVDPERDTPGLMQQYVAYFGEGNLGVTGEPAEIRKLADGLGIYFDKVPGDDGDYTVDHSAVVLLIDPDGDFRALFGAPHVAANFVHDLPIIMGRP